MMKTFIMYFFPTHFLLGWRWSEFTFWLLDKSEWVHTLKSLLSKWSQQSTHSSASSFVWVCKTSHLFFIFLLFKLENSTLQYFDDDNNDERINFFMREFWHRHFAAFWCLELFRHKKKWKSGECTQLQTPFLIKFLREREER